ncbi:MAG TPA: ABC transporter permease, partial [Blastocatellia bacterium]|nr:ABC transporter permease [Blastocatellia bacterium]
METLAQDLRYAARGILKRPGFSLIVIITLALGIGANTAIFSVVNAVLLSSLPYPAAKQLVVLTVKNDKLNLTQQPVSYPNVRDWQAQNQAFTHVAALRAESMSLTDATEPDRVNTLRTSVNILSLLGAKPALGRDFLPEEEAPEKANVALIGYGLWQRRYGGNPQLVGQQITLDG